MHCLFLLITLCAVIPELLGEIFAVSLVQGGPVPKFLQEWCYSFLLTGNLENITRDDIHDLIIIDQDGIIISSKWWSEGYYGFTAFGAADPGCECDHLNTIYLNLYKVTMHNNNTERKNLVNFCELMTFPVAPPRSLKSWHFRDLPCC